MTQPSTPRPELSPAAVLPALAGSLITGTITVIVSVAFAAMIFSGSLAEHRADAIGMMLFAAVALAAVMAITSTLPGLIAGTQDSVAAVLALIAASIAGKLDDPQAAFYTVVMAVALTAFLTGGACLLLGQFRLGNLIRFIPYPVIGGFLAGSGMLLVRGAAGMMADVPTDPVSLFGSDAVIKWLPGLVFALLLLGILRRFHHFLIVPGMLVGAGIVFYLVLALTGTSISEATDNGWLLSSLPGGGLWQPVTPADLKHVDWHTLAAEAGGLAAVAVVAVITLLLNASGIELATREDMDLNRELKAAGLANLLAGVGGGMAGTHILSETILVQRMGARTRLVGVFLAAICALVMVAGGTVLSYFPNPVLGGLLLFLGLDFLVTWLYDAWYKLPRADYVIVVLIMLAINVIGFLEGVGLGLALAIVLFVVSYSRVDVVRYALSGTQRRSNVVRPRLYQQLLHAKGDWLYILKLQGFIFFGTANALLEQVRQRIADPDHPRPRYVLFDFQLAVGLDASAVMSFVKLKQLAEAHQITLLFAGLAPDIERTFTRQLFDSPDAVCCMFPDLDHGVEWFEEQAIDTFQSVGLSARAPSSLLAQFQDVLGDPALVDRLLSYFTREDVPAGSYLVRQGDPPRGIVFIERGQVTIQLEALEGAPFRVRKMDAGTLVGELGTYLKQPATASVVMTQSGSVLHLTVEALERMEQTDPEVAAGLHRFMARVLAERVVQTTETLQALID